MAEKQDFIIPAQIRAGRALIDWSQEQLAKAADVGLSTVRDFEGMRRGAEIGGASAMRRALENYGVVFVAGDETNGPGVRLIGKQPNITRRPTRKNPYDYLPFGVEWKGRRVIVFIPTFVLDDLDETNRRTDAEYVASFDRHKARILQVTSAAIDAGRVAPDTHLHLNQNDFFTELSR